MKLLEPHALDHAASTPVRRVVAVRGVDTAAILRRAEHLDHEDRLLVLCALEMRWPHRKIASVLGRPGGTVSRRLRRLGKLLSEPHIVQLLDGPCGLTGVDREIAIRYFLRGHAIRRLAGDLAMSIHQVKARVEYFRGWFHRQSAGDG